MNGTTMVKLQFGKVLEGICKESEEYVDTEEIA